MHTAIENSENIETKEQDKKLFFSKKWKKRLALIIAIPLVILGAAFAYVYNNQDKILSFVIQEINKSLEAKIEVNSYQLDLFSQFPEVAIRFNNVVCPEVVSNPKQNLFAFKSIFINLNIWDVLQEIYDIKKLKFEEGEVNIVLLKNGGNNYTFWKTNSDSSSTRIALTEVEFKDTRFTLSEQESKTQIQSQIISLTLAGEFWKEEFKASIDLNSNPFTLIVGENEIFTKSHFRVQTNIVASPDTVTINQGTLHLNQLAFNANGKIYNGNSAWYFSGSNLALSRVIAAIPETFLPLKKQMQTHGETTINIDIKTGNNGIDINATASLKNGTYSTKNSPVEIENLSFTATFSNGKNNNLSGSKLHLENAKGKTKTGSFFCDVDIENFVSPEILISGELALNLEELMKISKPGIFENVKGEVTSNFTASNKYKSFAEIQTLALADAHFSGSLDLKNGYLKFTDANFAFQDINALVALNGKDINIKKLRLTSGESQITAEGTLENALQFSESAVTPQLKLNIKSERINIKEIAGWKFGGGGNSKMPFHFSAMLNVAHFYWDDFNGYNLRGNVKGSALKITGNNLQFKSSGGNIKADFVVNSVDKNLETNVSISNLNIQNLFMEFNNFGQNDLTAKNIAGELDALLNLKMRFGKNWEVLPRFIDLTSTAQINNGELNNYKPLESLSAYAEEEDLKSVKFSTLKNEIRIKNEKIIIPQMHISSNALDLDIEGTHYFNSNIDYSVRLQLRRVLSGNKQNKTGGYDDFIVIDDRPDQPFIWVNIGCTVSDPCPGLDQDKMKEDLKKGWQQQGNDLKNLFKKDSAKTQNTQPEYIFEWEEEEPDTSGKGGN